MKWQHAILVLLSLSQASYAASEASEFWSFSAYDAEGSEVPMRSFKDSKVIIVVNVASECGFTDRNYRELQILYERYHARGLEILAFPCDQFGGQEPGDDATILQFAHGTYSVTFPMFSKIEVNGPNAHPIFKYLEKQLSGFISDGIKWNFTKFLLVDGVPYARYGSSTNPLSFESEIASLVTEKDDEDDLVAGDSAYSQDPHEEL